MSFLRKLLGTTDKKEAEERMQRIAEYNSEMDRLDEKRREEKEHESKADKYWNEAIKFEATDSAKAVQLLKDITRDYGDTFTVRNYVVDSILRISKANGWWEEAIKICVVAQRLKPEQSKWYELEAQACLQESEGKKIEATELYLEQDTLRGKYYTTYLHFGDKFFQLGAHDRAWSLYDEAILLAAEENISPHKVRQSMAKLLLKEGKHASAVEILIFGICEAEESNEKGIPKYMVTDLKKALQANGFGSDSSALADELINTCKQEGRENSIDLFQTRLKNME